MDGHHNYDQQSYEYEDGNTRMSMSYQSSSYSAAGQPAFSSFGPPPPMMPAPPSSSFHNMHQQMHMAAMDHHHSAMNHFNNVRQSMHSNMLGMALPPMMQPELPMHAQMQLPPPPQYRSIMPIEESESSEESSSDESDGEAEEQRRQNMALQQQLLEQQQVQVAMQCSMQDKYTADKEELEAQRRAMEQRYKLDQQSIQRQGAKMDERLAKLEAKETRNRAEQEAKDAELRRLREQNNLLAQQRYQDAEKHRNEMAELARTQANKPQPEAAVFDTSALEKVIREVQAQQLSKADIEKVIEERVANQLQGLAKKKDIEAAGSQMQNALKMMPSGASVDQIQQAVNQELGKAVTSLSSKMAKQRAIEPAVPAAAYAPAPQAMPQLMSLPPLSQPKQLMMPSAMPEIVPSAMSKSKKDKKEKKVKSEQSQSSMLVAPDGNMLPASGGSSSLPEDFPDTASKISTWQRSKSSKHEPKALPSIAETLAADTTGRKSKSSKTAAPMPLTKGGGNALSVGNGSVQALPADFPDTASKISSWERSRDKKSSKSVMPSIEEAPTAITKQIQKSRDVPPIIEEAPTVINVSKLSKKSSRANEETPSAKIKSRKALPPVEQAPVGTLVKGTPAAMPNVSIADMPQLGGTMPTMPSQFVLPEDFPDTASQVSAWERGRTAKGLSAANVMPQIMEAPGGGELVRADKTKKSSKK